jgi:WhiB family transcriptional regulator, redox-sensing transcriptional regulator
MRTFDDTAQELLDVWAWRHRAACRNADLLTFFGPDDEGVRERAVRERRAKAICARCPVIGPCASHALRHREPYGIWGGLTERERRRLWPEPEAARGTA